MIIQPIKTRRLTSRSCTLQELMLEFLPELPERAVVAVSSKVVSLCEGRTVPVAGTNKEALIRREAAYYLPAHLSRYGHHFTIAGHTLIGSAGIDESNGGGQYVLWPQDPQASANQLRRWLRKHFKRREVGVLITDSASFPLRLGAMGIALAASGFEITKSYVGQPDLFGRPLKLERADVAGGLAAAATVAMGEGDECQPLALITGLPSLKFQARDPSPADLAGLRLTLETDLFAPFLRDAPWLPGEGPR